MAAAIRESILGTARPAPHPERGAAAADAAAGTPAADDHAPVVEAAMARARGAIQAYREDRLPPGELEALLRRDCVTTFVGVPLRRLLAWLRRPG